MTTTLSRRPDLSTSAPGRVRTFGATAAFAALAMLTSYLPFSAMNALLGPVGATTHTRPGALRWVTDSFTIAITIALIAGGAAAQRYGARRLVIIGLTLTAAGSLVSCWAQTFTGQDTIRTLEAGQAVAGAGAGLVMSASLVLIALTAPAPTARTRAISFWAAANVTGLGLGPFVSTAVASWGEWRWTFALLAVLAAAVATIGSLTAQPGQPTSATSALTQARLVITRAPQLFRSSRFTAAGLAAVVALLTMIGAVFEFSLSLHSQGVTDTGIATRLACLFGGNVIASVLSGPLQRRIGSRTVLMAGLLITALGLTTTLANPGSTLPQLAWRLALLGLGAGLVIATGAAVAVASAPTAEVSRAATVHNVVRQLGGVIGPAALAGASLHAALLALLVVVVATAGAVGLLLTHQP